MSVKAKSKSKSKVKAKAKSTKPKDLYKFKVIPLGPYATTAYVSLGQSIQELSIELGRELNEDPHAVYLFLLNDDTIIPDDIDSEDDGCDEGSCMCTKAETIMLPNGRVIIWVHKLIDDPTELNWIQHEVNHAAYFIMDRIDTRLSGDTTEVMAYLTEYLTDEIYEMLNISVKQKTI